MKIRSEAYLRLSLLFPIIVLAAMIPIANIALYSFGPAPIGGSSWEFVSNSFVLLILGGSAIYSAGANFWLIPYTALAIFLWLWSRNRNRRQITKVYVWSPVYLLPLMRFYSLILGLLYQTLGIGRLYFATIGEGNFLDPFFLLLINICALPITLFIGYSFIVVLGVIHDILRHRGIIVDGEINSLMKAK